MGEFRVVMETGGGDGWKGVSKGGWIPGRDGCSFFGECKMHGVKRARGWVYWNRPIEASNSFEFH